MKKKKSEIEIEDESLPFIVGTGSYCGYSGEPAAKRKRKVQIGFIRQGHATTEKKQEAALRKEREDAICR